MESKRLVLNVRTLAGRTTGVQRYARELALIRVHGEPLVSLAPSVAYSHGTLGHLWEQLVLPFWLSAGCDLLISPGNTGPIACARQVVVVHDMATFDMPQAFSWRFSWWYRGLLRVVLRRACLIVAVSEFTKARIAHWMPSVAHKVEVVHNGVSPAIANAFTLPSWSQLCALRDVPERYLLFVGSLDPRKNLSRLLSAWDSARLSAEWRLVVVGAENERIFRSPILRSQRGDRVLFLGYVPVAQLDLLYAHAAAVICPSLYEGFGLPPLEAISRGCRRIIVSDIPPFREILGNEVAYVDPLEKHSLCEALNRVGNGQLVPMSDATANELVKRFSWNNMRADFVRVLEQRRLI